MYRKLQRVLIAIENWNNLNISVHSDSATYDEVEETEEILKLRKEKE